MLYRIKDLFGHTIEATDGRVGVARDFCFDDRLWRVRYIVVAGEGRLPAGEVVLLPLAFCEMEPEGKRFYAGLSSGDLEKSPAVAPDMPLQPGEAERLRAYYRWPPYWTGVAALTRRAAADLAETGEEEMERSLYLRSCGELIGCRLEAPAGRRGEVTDLMVDDENWVLRHLVVAIREGPGRGSVMGPLEGIEEIDWRQRLVKAELPEPEG